MASLDWVEQRSEQGEEVVVSASSSATSESELQAAVDTAVERAVELMARNVKDESRYFICEWNTPKALLNIVVTDDSKTFESPVALELEIPSMNQFAAEKSAELVKFWITDYLSTCSDFLRFSVIALFHTGDRSRGVLL